MTNRELANHLARLTASFVVNSRAVSDAIDRLRSLPEPEAVADAIGFLEGELSLANRASERAVITSLIAKMRGNP